MAGIERSPQSKRDAAEIWAYIAEDNFDAAERLLETFDKKATLLAEMSGMGRPREDLMPSLRSYRVGNYAIYDRPIPGGIELVRIIHGSRDVERVFGAK